MTAQARAGTSRRTRGGWIPLRVRRNRVLRAFMLGVRSMRVHRGIAALFLAATLAQGVLQGALVWGLRHVLIEISATGSTQARAMIGGAMAIFALWLTRALSTAVGEVMAGRLAYRVEREMVMRVLRKLLAISVRFFDRNAHGDLILASHNDIKGVRFVTLEVGAVTLHAARLVGLVVVAWLMSPKLTLLGLLLVPLGLLPAYWLGHRVTAGAQREREMLVGMTDTFLQVASAIRVIKVNRSESRVLREAEAYSMRMYEAVVRQVQARSLSRLLFEAVLGLGLVLVLVVGGREVATGALEWQSLLSLLIAIVAVYSPVMGLLAVYNALNALLPNLGRIETLLAEPEEAADPPNARRLLTAPAVIGLHRLSFAYDHAPVLHELSATFYRGETIGLVGPSGAGKTTLVSLMLRLFEPSGGRITFDGVDLCDVRRSDLMELCAIVLQEPVLFLGTVADNIRLARPDAPMDAVIAAARAAHLHDEIMAMPGGYDTLLGRRRDARGISVGQRQRIAIAAALLKDSPLLFLDEATSSLDSVSERAVQAATTRLMAGRTTFVVAHRLSTLRSADRILVLDRGRMVGLGAHEQLLADCPTYARLWALQSMEAADSGSDASDRTVAAVGRDVAGAAGD